MGGKFETLERIAYFLDTGNRDYPQDKVTRPKSKFDWHSADLTPDTVITDNYKNSQNVRRFFKTQVGDSFKFNIRFMNWMRENTGRTLKDAAAAYQVQKAEAAEPGYQSDIAYHNQFNQYTRDFLANNPHMGMKDVRYFWALKRQLPSDTGRHVCHYNDLKLSD